MNILCIEPTWLTERVNALNAGRGILSKRYVGRDSILTNLGNGLVQIEVSGPISKTDSLMMQLFGGVSANAIKNAFDFAADTESIRGILLGIDSPGGSVAGLEAAADAIIAAAKVKPVFGVIQDLGASGAYWLGSQSSRIFANRTGLVGSIGSYLVMTDFTKMAEKIGLKVHVVKAGALKGTGVPGTEITNEQLAYIQELVNDTNAHFLNAVSAGRRMPISKVRSIADGRVHTGDKALQLGLIDQIGSASDALAALDRAATPAKQKLTAAQELNAVLKTEMKTSGSDRQTALQKVYTRDPELRQRYLQSTHSNYR